MLEGRNGYEGESWRERCQGVLRGGSVRVEGGGFEKGVLEGE